MKRSEKLEQESFELKLKIINLLGFINSKEFENICIVEQQRLRDQNNIMRKYRNILEQRIDHAILEERE